MNREVHVELGF